MNTHDSGTIQEYELEIVLASLWLLNRALLCIWYFNGYRQTNKQSRMRTHPDSRGVRLTQERGPAVSVFDSAVTCSEWIRSCSLVSFVRFLSHCSMQAPLLRQW